MNRRQPSSIAIDGPTASGKSVVGRALARSLGYRFVDTGAMYRAITWLALREAISTEDEAKLTRLATLHTLRPATTPDDEGIVVDATFLGAELSSRDVEAAVSLVSRVKGVRDALVLQQRRLAGEGRLVMAGRDIGTVVLPEADLKLYLTASPRVRARRRLADLQRAGVAVTYEDVLVGLKRRDRLDSERAVSPLRPAGDAQIIETDHLEVTTVLAAIASLLERWPAAGRLRSGS